VGHTKGYIKVLVPYDKELAACVAQVSSKKDREESSLDSTAQFIVLGGGVMQVCVTGVARWHLLGEVLSHHKIIGSQADPVPTGSEVVLRHHLKTIDCPIPPTSAFSCGIAPGGCSLAKAGTCHCSSAPLIGGATSTAAQQQLASSTILDRVYASFSSQMSDDEGQSKGLGVLRTFSFYVLVVLLASFVAWVLRVSEGMF